MVSGLVSVLSDVVGSLRAKGHVAVEHADEAHPEVQAFAKSACRITYRPTWFLRGRFFQTLASEVPGPSIQYTRQTVKLDEHVFSGPRSKHRCAPDVIPRGTVSLDWCDASPGATGPIVLICPGTTGDSSSPYVTKLAGALLAAKEGFRPVVYNPRGMGGNVAETPFLYSMGYTHDLRRAVEKVKQAADKAGAKVYAVGFSMGGNYLAKFLGEEGERCVVDRACCLANPVDVKHVIDSFSSSSLGKYVLQPLLMWAARGSPTKNWPKEAKAAMTKAATIKELDSTFIAPAMGCSSIDEYYNEASCKHFLSSIACPTLFLHADNDPVVSIPSDFSDFGPNVVSVVTTGGGHSLNWPTGWSMNPWAHSVVLDFFRASQKP